MALVSWREEDLGGDVSVTFDCADRAITFTRDDFFCDDIHVILFDSANSRVIWGDYVKKAVAEAAVKDIVERDFDGFLAAWRCFLA